MSQFYQPQDNFPPQQGYGYQPAGNQQPTGGFQPQPGGYPPPGNQQPTGGFQPQPAGYPLPGNPQPTGGFLPGSFQAPAGNRNFRQPANAALGARPFSVTVAAIAVAVIGGLDLLLVLFSLCGLNILSSLTNALSTLTNPLLTSPTTSGMSSQITAALGLDNLILVIFYFSLLGFSQLYMARNIWQLKSWAYWGAIGIQGFNILVQLIVFISNRNGAGFFAGVYIPVLLAGYLLIVGEVRRTFQVSF